MARVDLWLSFEAELTPRSLATYRDWLSPDETARWVRFRREEDRRRYLLARGLVRGVLSDYTQQPPEALAFDVQAQGKPVLRTAPGLHFNLSHTRGLVALAVCREAELGVDVEAIDPSLDPLRLAARHFSPRERETLAAAEAAQYERFFEVWTLKEAWLKALGCGLGRDLDNFTVVLDEPEPRIIEHQAGGADRPAQCRCRLYTPQPGYRLAIVVRGAAPRIDVRVFHGMAASPPDAATCWKQADTDMI